MLHRADARTVHVDAYDQHGRHRLALTADRAAAGLQEHTDDIQREGHANDGRTETAAQIQRQGNSVQLPANRPLRRPHYAVPGKSYKLQRQL